MLSSSIRISALAAVMFVVFCATLVTGMRPASAYIYDTRFCRHHPRDPHCHPHGHRGYHRDRFGHWVPNR